MTETDNNKSVTIRPNLQRALATSHRNRLLLFYATGCAEPKLFIKRPTSVKNGTMHLYTMLKKRKTKNTPPKAGASAISTGIKEKDVTDELKTAASSTLSKQRNTAMRKPIKEMASLCSIYDANLKFVVEKHELGEREDLGWKANLILVSLPYNEQSDQNNDHAEYEVLGSNDTKDGANVLQHVMTPETHVHMFGSAL